MRSVICAAVALSALALATPSHAAPITGACPTATAMDFTVSPRPRRAKNLVPGMLVNFVQGGAGSGCVVVMFTTTYFTSSGSLVNLGPVMDADTSPIHPPSGPTLVAANFQTPLTVLYIFPNVSPGPHKMQMEISPPTEAIYMYSKTILVYHTP